MQLDLRSLREWLLVALNRGRVTDPGLVGPGVLAPSPEAVAATGTEVHPQG